MIKKLMKVEEFPDAIWYRVACGCSDSSHDIDLWVEVDEYLITMNMTSTTSLVRSNKDEPWYKWIWGNFVWRAKTAWKILAFGEAKYEAEVVLTDDNIEAFLYAMVEAEKKLKEYRNKSDE